MPGFSKSGQFGIKSIQRGTIALSASTTGTATITSVDTSNALIRFLGCAPNTPNGDSKTYVRVTLTNATTVTATIDTAPTPAVVTVSFEVVEYYPGVIKSIQRGTVVNGTPATITAVDLTAATLDYLGFSDPNGASSSNTLPYISLTNSTTVTVTEAAATSCVVSFQVTEWF